MRLALVGLALTFVVSGSALANPVPAAQTTSAVLAAGGGGDHGGAHANPKARPQAPEDVHWWLGQEIFPLSLREKVAELIGPSFIDKDPAAKLNVAHIFFGVLVFFIGIFMALAARRKVMGQVLPPNKWGAAAFFDILMEGILGLMTSMMPREKAIRFLPLVTAAAVFILISNLLGLVPGFVPPTQSFNTTLALGSVAFIYYNYHGIRTHGVVKYLKHFMGPMLALAPLMLVIELISHCVRPLSLGLRLMGNMFGDHQVLFIFMSFGLPLVPLPIMALGTLVCIVQTVVFTLLFIVYIALAVEEHDHGHDDHGHEGHGHDGHGAHAAAHAH
jgi:F-type H+-transporting ATPase subunit a